MVTQAFAALGALFLGASSVFAVGSVLPTEVTAPVSKLFIPAGFDDNDNVEIVAHGYFNDSCYRVGHATSTIDNEKREINLKITAYRYRGEICLQVLTPFISPVKVGLLKDGEYTVHVGNTEVAAEFLVEKATTESPDTHNYAPVDYADIRTDYQTGTQELVLQGSYPHMFIGCAVMDEVRTYVSPQDVLVVLPIMKILDDKECDPNYSHAYKYTKRLEEKFVGAGLIHVRVLNGNSYNKFINIPE